MIELKKKALGGIKQMLGDRMAERLKPKAVSVEIESVGGKPSEMLSEGGSSYSEPSMPNDDMGGLTPEEKMELERLLEKAGC